MKSIKESTKKWLDEDLNYHFEMEYTSSNINLKEYYNDDDIEVINSKCVRDTIGRNISHNRYIYFTKDNIKRKKSIYISPYTRRYKCDIIYRILVDICEKRGYKYDNKCLIGKHNKSQLYSFLLQHS